MITFQEFKAEVNQVYQQDAEFTDLTSDTHLHSSYAYIAIRVFDKVVYTKDGMWQYLCTGSSNYNTSLLAPSLLKAVDKAIRESETSWQRYIIQGQMMSSRIIYNLGSRDDLPLVTTNSMARYLPKLDFILPSGGYIKQDYKAELLPHSEREHTRTRESYELDLPMLNKIKRQAIGTPLEEYVNTYTGNISACSSYVLGGQFLSWHYELDEQDDELFLGKMLWLFLDDTILRVGRVVRIVKMVCNEEDNKVLESIVGETMIPSVVLGKSQGKMIAACIATDFIEVNVRLNRECLYGS